MARKKTHEQFMKDFYERNKNAKNIEILEKYQGSHTKILCKCKIDGYEWKAKPNNLLNNSGCLICSTKIIQNKQRKTTETFIKEMAEINSYIEILGEYVNNKTHIKCRCKIDGYEWKARPDSLIQGKGCLICSIRIIHDEQRLTHEEFIKKLYEENKNADNIEILGKYTNRKTHILCKCKIDDYEWSPTPNDLLSGCGCPICNASKGEKTIAKYLKEHNIDFKDQYRFDDCRFKQTLPFDFYIPSLNIAIEYDGKYHYKIINKSKDKDKNFNNFIDTKIRDTIKTIYCKENNIRLIRIPYWEFDNIENILDKIFLK